MKRLVGFTLVEVVVVVSVIAILAAVVFANFGEGREQSRDAQRQADLRNLQTAIELYKNEHGRYPAGCNGPGNWSGQKGTNYECSNSTGIYSSYVGTGQYIIGHEAGISFAPKFIRILPTDPKLNGSNSGYIYAVNAQGTVYKLMVKNTVESEIVTRDHLFKSCDISNQIGVPCNPPVAPFRCDVAICDRVFTANSYSAQTASSPKPPECNQTHPQFRTSYAVWGGYFSSNFTPGTEQYTAHTERFTEPIACKM